MGFEEDKELFSAVENGDVTRIVEINNVGVNGDTNTLCLIKACEMNDTGVIMALKQYKVLPNALWHLTKHDNAQMFKYLFNRSHCRSNYNTLLADACSFSYDIAKFLILNGAKQTHYAVINAVKHDQVKIMSLFADRVSSSDIYTVKSLEMLKYLTAQGCKNISLEQFPAKDLPEVFSLFGDIYYPSLSKSAYEQGDVETLTYLYEKLGKLPKNDPFQQGYEILNENTIKSDAFIRSKKELNYPGDDEMEIYIDTVIENDSVAVLSYLISLFSGRGLVLLKEKENIVCYTLDVFLYLESLGLIKEENINHIMLSMMKTDNLDLFKELLTRTEFKDAYYQQAVAKNANKIIYFLIKEKIVTPSSSSIVPFIEAKDTELAKKYYKDSDIVHADIICEYHMFDIAWFMVGCHMETIHDIFEQCCLENNYLAVKYLQKWNPSFTFIMSGKNIISTTVTECATCNKIRKRLAYLDIEPEDEQISCPVCSSLLN